MVKKNLIYRKFRPVYWSPSTKFVFLYLYFKEFRTALAEAELEYVDNHKSTAAYVKFNIKPTKLSSLNFDDNTHFLIWTTTPWTLPSNKVFNLI